MPEKSEPASSYNKVIKPEQNSISIDNSTLQDKPKNTKQDSKKMESINEEDLGDMGSELKSNTLFEGMAFLYQHQMKLEENQKRIEEKLDNIIKMLKKSVTKTRIFGANANYKNQRNLVVPFFFPSFPYSSRILK